MLLSNLLISERKAASGFWSKTNSPFFPYVLCRRRLTDEKRNTVAARYRYTMKNSNVVCGIMNHAKKWHCSLLGEKARFHTKFDEDLKQGISRKFEMEELLEMEKTNLDQIFMVFK